MPIVSIGSAQVAKTGNWAEFSSVLCSYYKWYFLWAFFNVEISGKASHKIVQTEDTSWKQGRFSWQPVIRWRSVSSHWRQNAAKEHGHTQQRYSFFDYISILHPFLFYEMLDIITFFNGVRLLEEPNTLAMANKRVLHVRGENRMQKVGAQLLCVVGSVKWAACETQTGWLLTADKVWRPKESFFFCLKIDCSGKRNCADGRYRTGMPDVAADPCWKQLLFCA